LPKKPNRKLKVFQAQFGFFDMVLAAPSQAAALRAWGTHRNLFATGHAKLATDEAAIAAALEHPGTLLRRAVGSNDPFSVEPTSLPKVRDLAATMPEFESPPKAQPQPKQKPKPPPARKPPPDRSRLDAAEAALQKLEEQRVREEADLRRQQEELDAKREAAQQSYIEARKRATAEVTAAREAFRKAGGTD
jgi:outer membrane biosynthesis protein TonB